MMQRQQEGQADAPVKVALRTGWSSGNHLVQSCLFTKANDAKGQVGRLLLLNARQQNRKLGARLFLQNTNVIGIKKVFHVAPLLAGSLLEGPCQMPIPHRKPARPSSSQ